MSQLQSVQPLDNLLISRFEGESEPDSYILLSELTFMMNVGAHTNIATHSLNVIRNAVYQNVVLNLSSIDLSKIKVLDKFKPIYSDAMFK